MKHNSMTYIQIGKIICACNKDLSHIRRMAEWLKSVNVKGQFLGPTMARAGPTLLNLKFEQLEDNLDFLERYGVRNEWIGYVVTKCPQLLVMSIEELDTRICFYKEMGLNERDFGTMVFDYPRALGYFSLEEMKSKVLSVAFIYFFIVVKCFRKHGMFSLVFLFVTTRFVIELTQISMVLVVLIVPLNPRSELSAAKLKYNLQPS
jgi:mTERF